LKSLAARVIREPENSVAAEAEPGQKYLVRAAIVVVDDLVQYRVELRCIRLVPAPYITTLRANYYEWSGQNGPNLCLPCGRPVCGDTVGIATRQCLPSAVEKAQYRILLGLTCS